MLFHACNAWWSTQTMQHAAGNFKMVATHTSPVASAQHISSLPASAASVGGGQVSWKVRQSLLPNCRHRELKAPQHSLKTDLQM